MQIKFFSGGALAALAAALALTAVPASAREANRNDNHGRYQENRSDNGQRGQRGGGRDQAAARPERAAPQAPQQRSWTPQARPQQAQQQQRTWSRQDRPQQTQRGGAQRGNWSDPAQTQQSQQTQRWGDNDRRTERNRTYTNRDRNTTYNNSGSNWRDRRGTDNNWRDDRSGERNWRDGNRDGQRWDRNWRSSNRYDWQRYRTANRNAYHIGRYYAPYRNYSYRRLGIGFSLNSLFYSDRYWISDPWQYRLPEAYGPYRWVRYYDDALLVDIYSGEVVDVIYDFFW